MKVRTDFVTNSSSSSFIVARKGGFNEKQKEEILDYIERLFLSGKDIETLEELNRFAQDIGLSEDDADYKKMNEAIESGCVVLYGTIPYEGPYGSTDGIYRNIWKIMEKNSDGNFILLNDYAEY